MSGRTGAGACLAVVLWVAATPLAAAQSPPTQIVIYSPFRVGEGLVGKVVSQEPGTCRSGSVADPRKNAWLCFNAPYCPRLSKGCHFVLYDPCFSGSRNAGYVVCPQSEASGAYGASLIRLNLIKPLPVANGVTGPTDTSGFPVAIRLVSGATCTLGLFPPGTWIYNCTVGYALESSLDRTGSAWTIAYSSRNDFESTNPTTSVQIAVAYW